jgi:hypothetical protein
MKKIWLLLLCVVLTTSFTSAQQKPPTNGVARGTQSAPKAKGMPFYGKVGAIDKAANTITLDGKEKKRIFYFTSATKVHRDKQPAKVDDVVLGQWVGGFVRPDANGRPIVENLNLAVTQRNTGSTSTNAVKSGGAGRK